ncbi:MAG: molecular chaperone TorD family protein [Sulfuricella denitrificans]|nr:molecular chaperone TorD family protein [Sulfuricella denitrificans]
MPIPGEVKTSGVSPEALRLLAGLLASPDGDSLEVLRELAGDHAWLHQALAELDNLPLEEWQAEHTRLFISGHPKTACPPFESAFLGGMMFGAASEHLGDLYRRAGLQADGAPTDYLGTMLECAAWLQEQQCSHSSELLRELWADHLAMWAPRFGATLGEEGRLELYRQLGHEIRGLFHD